MFIKFFHSYGVQIIEKYICESKKLILGIFTHVTLGKTLPQVPRFLLPPPPPPPPPPGREKLLIPPKATFLRKSVHSSRGLQTLLKVTLLHECFSRFVNCTNGTKSRNAFYIKILLYPRSLN